MTLRLPALVIAGVLLGGCGADDRPEPTPAQEAALATLIDAELAVDEQRCMLDGLISSEVAPEAVIDDSTTADEDALLLSLTVECIDDLTDIPAFVEAFVEGAAAEGTTLTDAQARCAIESLGDVDPATALRACVLPPDTTDDPIGLEERVALELELLTTLCTDGNNQACDDLFASAPPDSDASEHGRTCAGQLPDSEGRRCYLDLDA